MSLVERDNLIQALGKRHTKEEVDAIMEVRLNDFIEALLYSLPPDKGFFFFSELGPEQGRQNLVSRILGFLPSTGFSASRDR